MYEKWYRGLQVTVWRLLQVKTTRFCLAEPDVATEVSRLVGRLFAIQEKLAWAGSLRAGCQW